MNFIRKLFSWFHKPETIEEQRFPTSEPNFFLMNHPIRKKSNNIRRLEGYRTPKIDLSSTPKKIKNYLSLNLTKIEQIITFKLPHCPIWSDKQAESLPVKHFELYDIDGNDVELGFETESIFIHPENKSVERIFYEEINQISFIPIKKFRDSFVVFVVDSKFGFRTFIFLEKKYMEIITKIINQHKTIFTSYFK